MLNSNLGLFLLAINLSWINTASASNAIPFKEVVAMIHEKDQGIILGDNLLFPSICSERCFIEFKEIAVMWGRGKFKGEINTNADEVFGVRLEDQFVEAQKFGGSGYLSGMIYIDSESFISNDYKELIEEYVEVYNHKHIKYHNAIDKKILIDFTAYHELAHSVNIFDNETSFDQQKNENFADVMAVLLVGSSGYYDKKQLLDLVDYLSLFRQNHIHINNDNEHDSIQSLAEIRVNITNDKYNFENLDLSMLSSEVKTITNRALGL